MALERGIMVIVDNFFIESVRIFLVFSKVLLPLRSYFTIDTYVDYEKEKIWAFAKPGSLVLRNDGTGSGV